MSLKVFLTQLFGKELTVGPYKKEARILRLPFSMELSLLIEPDKHGFRLATKSELEEFAKKYPLSWWHPVIVGIDQPVFDSKAGVFAKVYKIRGSWVEEVHDDVTWELPCKTHILLVQDAVRLF